MCAVYGQNDDTACIRMSVDDKNADSVQVRRQEFVNYSIASCATPVRGSGGRSRPPEALGYLEQNPAI